MDYRYGINKTILDANAISPEEYPPAQSEHGFNNIWQKDSPIEDAL